MTRFVRTSAVIISLTIAGCQTLGDATRSRGNGDVAVFSAPSATVLAAMPDVIRTVGLGVVSSNAAEGEFLAQRGATAFSWGENVAVYVSDGAAPTETRIEVISKASYALNVTAPNWSRDIFRELERRFGRRS